MENDTSKLAVFKGKNIRRTIHHNEWWFSVSDIIATLTDSLDPRQYVKKMRQRDPELDSNWGTICTPLQMIAQDGKKRDVNCANTEGVFRIIQSIPSPKAEPFKRWLAKVGYERIQEIDDPELGTKRTRALYKAKGYPDDWIEIRMRGIAIREDLTDEWQKRGVEENREYAILTAEIHEATFGLKPGQHKKLKGLEWEICLEDEKERQYYLREASSENWASCILERNIKIRPFIPTLPKNGVFMFKPFKVDVAV